MSTSVRDTLLWGPKSWGLKELVTGDEHAASHKHRVTPPKTKTVKETGAAAEEAAEEERRRRRGGSMRGLLTGGLGLEERAPVKRKRLLGE
jgi:hypothetical protein